MKAVEYIHYILHYVTYHIIYYMLYYMSQKPKACNFIKKETLVQVLSCQFFKISRSTFSTEHLQTTASVMDYTVLSIIFSLVLS